MITAIPAQPLAFNDTSLIGCFCAGPDRCLLVLPTDTIQAQIAGVTCTDSVEELADTSTTDGTTWNPGDWQQIQGGLIRQSCIDTEGFTDSPAPLFETGFTATIGTYYTVTFTIQSINGFLSASFAGVDLGVFTSVGTYTFTVAALFASSWSFTLGGDYLAGCISYASVRETNTDLTVRVFNNSTGNQVDSWIYADQPQRFHFDRDHFVIDIPVGEIGPGGLGLVDGCYFIRVVDNCDSVTLESQCINVQDHGCTILLTACNSTDVGGIYFGDYTHAMRVRGKVVRPNWKYSVKEERLSNGDINRYYADRTTAYELRIDQLDEFSNDFLSTLALMDHVYIGQEEFVFDANSYTPEYNDIWDDQAPIKIIIRPKQELYRKVRCEDDNGSCAPPPNYWVEGTGPNTLYILNETDGSRIPLNS